MVFALAGLAVWTYVQFIFAIAPTTLPSNQLVVRRSPVRGSPSSLGR